MPAVGEALERMRLNGHGSRRREPRSVAEDLRQMLLEQFRQSYSDVKAEFKTLEDLDTIVNVAGTHMATAHYILTVNFNAAAVPKPGESPAAARARKQ